MSDRLDEIRARLEAADEGDLTRYDHGGGRLIDEGGEYRVLIAQFYQENNREFYANAPADIEFLLDRIEYLERKVEVLEQGGMTAEDVLDDE